MSFYEKTVTRNYRRLRWALTSAAQKKKLRAAAIAYIQQDSEAYALFKLAQKDGISISFEPGLTGTTALACYRVDFFSGKRSIAVNPYLLSGDLISPEKLAPALVHELRHHWQYKKIGLEPKTGNRIDGEPRLAFIFNRVAEADAYAFEDRFVHVVNQLNDISTRAIDKVIQVGEQNPGKPSLAKIQSIALEQLIETKALLDSLPFKQRANFITNLSDKGLSDSYDPAAAAHLHRYHTATITTPFSKAAPVTLKDIKKVTAGYLGPMSDAKFEELVLGHAHPQARATVDLMEQFRTAAAANDNKKAEALRQKVIKKIRNIK